MKVKSRNPGEKRWKRKNKMYMEEDEEEEEKET